MPTAISRQERRPQPELAELTGDRVATLRTIVLISGTGVLDQRFAAVSDEVGRYEPLIAC